MSINLETVIDVRHVTENHFYIKTTRNSNVRFRNGEFLMIGLNIDSKPLLRAYSVASPNYEDYLEFYSIKVENGPLTSKLKDIKPQEKMLVNTKATGTLVIDNLKEGRNLYLISTGTGIAPFLSIAKAIETYEIYDKVILMHGVSYIKELAFDKELRLLNEDEKYGLLTKGNFYYYPTVTREEYINKGRVTKAFYSNEVSDKLDIESFDKDKDRVMICGSMDMNMEFRDYFIDKLGVSEGNMKEKGEFVLERAFVG